MSVTTSEMMDLAVSHLGASKSEVEYRNVIGRAYYSAYHGAKTFYDGLPTKGLVPSQPCGSHKKLWYGLSNPTVTDVGLIRKNKIIGGLCKQLHYLRCQADYHLDDDLGATEAELSLKIASEILKELS